jgi:hypothetical protein
VTLRWLQQNLPWQGSYTEAFESGPKHNHFVHNVLHLAKAVGKLAAAVEPLDHHHSEAVRHVSTALADVVICAIRLANVYPEHPVDLETEVIKRLREKNELPEDWGDDLTGNFIKLARLACRPNLDPAQALEVVDNLLAEAQKTINHEDE